MSILIAEDLAKQYNSREVVKSLSINVKSGEIVGLLGPNGAGKTTAFYMIVGLASCKRGQISIDDNNLTSLPMHQRAKLGLGYLPQEASIFRKLTVEQNILAVLQIQPDLKTAGIEEILERLLNQMNIKISNKKNLYFSGLKSSNRIFFCCVLFLKLGLVLNRKLVVDSISDFICR